MRQVGEILARVHDAEKVREAISGTTITAVVDGTLVLILTVVLWLSDKLRPIDHFETGGCTARVLGTHTR